MKNFSAKIWLVFMGSIFALTAFALEPVTLKDNHTGMTVDLYPTDSANFLFYGNMKIGYSVIVPSMVFTEVVLLPENEDGMILESKDGTARFRVTGGYVMDDEGKLRDSFNRALSAIYEKDEHPYFDTGDDFWQITWRESDETLHIRKFLLKKGAGVWSEFEIHYETSEGEVHPFARIIDDAIESLVFGEG